MEFLEVTSKVGDWTSLVVQKIINGLSKMGVGITDIQSKIITALILGFGIYLIFTLVSKTRKLLKWGLIILFIILIISILTSMFV